MLTITADFSNHACKDNERVPTPMQIYGKIANFKDFYKINDMSDEAQILHGDYLDH